MTSSSTFQHLPLVDWAVGLAIDRTPVTKNETTTVNKNYSTRDSHVVTHHSTNLAIHCLTRVGLSGREAMLSVFYDRSWQSKAKLLYIPRMLE
jgi:hypothetical protein